MVLTDDGTVTLFLRCRLYGTVATANRYIFYDVLVMGGVGNRQQWINKC